MNLKRFSNKKIFLAGLMLAISVSWLAFVLHPAFATESIQFDPQGTIKNELKLPDKSPVDITIRTIQWVLGFLGMAAVVMILIGGFMWMTSAGNEERVKKAKTILTSAVIGMIIILLSWALVTFVIGRVDEVTTPAPSTCQGPCDGHWEGPPCICKIP